MSLGHSARAPRPLEGAFLGVGLSVLLVIALTSAVPHTSVLGVVAPATLLIVCVYFVVNPRFEVSLAILVAYLGLLDGYLKLRTGSTTVTLVRDALFYSIVIGVLLRAAARGDRLAAPPFAVHVLAFALLVLVQLANPANVNLKTAFSGLRPQLEWLPLFFLGFLVLRDVRRLRWFFVLLLGLACVNGVVGLVQFNLSPQALANWGPGYSERIFATGDFAGAGATFVDATSIVRVRPFALGDQEGFGGLLAVLAIPGTFALIGFTSSRKLGALALFGLGGLALAVVTSQARSVLLGAIGVFVAYGVLSARSRQGGVAILTLAAGIAVSYVLVTAFVSSNQSGAFARYQTIGPSQIGTTFASRATQLDVVPVYFKQIPLGGGLGRTGPAAVVATGGLSTYNAETEFSYLMVEIGVPGMLALLTLTLRLLAASFRILSRLDEPETRAMIAGLAAPFFGILGLWFVSAVSAIDPLAPYFWFAAGGLAYWLGHTTSGRRGVRWRL